MHPLRLAVAVATAAIVPSLIACSADPNAPQPRSIHAVSASLDDAAAPPAQPAAPEEKPVPDGSFSEADENAE